MSMWCWVISPFYDFCSFWSVAVDKLQFLSFIFAVLSITVHFIALSLVSAIMHQPTTILLKLMQMVMRCQDFFLFPRWQLATMLNFETQNLAPKLGFGVIWSPKWAVIWMISQKEHPCVSQVFSFPALYVPEPNICRPIVFPLTQTVVSKYWRKYKTLTR